MCFIARIVLFNSLLWVLWGVNTSALAQFKFCWQSSVSGFTYNTAPTLIPGIVAGSDDVLSGAVPLPFPFTYNNTPVFQFKVSSNGWLTFNTGYLTSDPINNLTAGVRPVIAPLWDDLQVDPTGSVNYQTTGFVGSRILTIEWRNMRWSRTAATAGISFQVKLFEGTNVIQFAYKDEVGTLNTPSASIGLGANTTGPFSFYSVDNVFSAASNAVETNTIATRPANGTVMVWTPLNNVVWPQPTPISSPTKMVCSGDTVIAAATRAITLWEYSADGGVTWNPAGSGFNSAPIVSAPNATGTNRTDWIRANWITGCSDTVYFIVRPQPNILDANRTVCSGDTIQVQGGPDFGLFSNWQYKPAGGVAISAGTNYLLSNPITTQLNISGIDRVDTIFAIYGSGCRDTMLVTVKPQPNILSGNLSICSEATFTVSASIASYWYYKPFSGTLTLIGGPSGTSPVFTAPINISGFDRIDTVFAYKDPAPAGCRDTLIITVRPRPDITTALPNTCSGGFIQASAAALVDNWFYKPQGGVPVPSGSSSTTSNIIKLNENISGANRIDTVIAQLANGCRDVELVTVYPQPNIITPNQTICSQQTLTINAAAAVNNWFYRPGGGVLTPLGGGGTAGTTVTANINNSGAVRIDTVFAASALGCQDTVILTINPEPNIVTSPLTVCSGQPVNAGAAAAANWFYKPAGGTETPIGVGVVNSNTINTPLNISGVNRIDTIIAQTGSCRAKLLVTVQPQPNILTPNQTVCSSPTLVITSATATQNWYYKPGGGVQTGAGTASASSNPITFLNTTTAVRVDTVFAENILGCRDTVIITVNPEPQILTTPPTVCSGTAVAVNAAAIANSWQYKPAGGTAVTIGTATASVVANTQLNTDGVNRIDTVFAILMPSGCRDTLLITVNPQPNITTPNQTVCSGVTFSATAAAPAFEWYYRPEGGAFTFISGAGASSAPITFTNTGVTNRVDTVFAYQTAYPTGCKDTLLITVRPQPVILDVDRTVCSGDTLQMQAATAVDSWFYKPAGGAPIPAGTATIVSNVMTAPMNISGAVRVDTVIAQYSTGCRSTLLVNVNPQPNITTPNQTICSGVTFTAAASATVTTWQYKPAGGVPTIVGTASPTSNPFVITNITGAVRVDTVFAFLAGCRDTLILTVQPQPNIITAPPTVCSGQQVQAAATQLVNNWFYKPAGGVATPAGTNSLTSNLITTELNTTGANRIDTIIAQLATGCRSVLLVTVQPQPNITTPNQTVCSGFTITAAASAIVTTWEYKPQGGAVTIVGGASATSNPISLINTSGVDVVDTIFAVSAAGCRDTLLMTVKSQPVITSPNVTVCSGNSVIATAGSAVDWLYKPAGGGSSSAGTATAISNPIITAANITASNRIDTVFAILTASGCRDTMLITVQPQPNITTPNQTVCSGRVLTITSTLITDNWIYKPEGGVAVAAGAGAAASNAISFVNTGAVARVDTVFAEYITGCRDTALITVNPQPVITTVNPTVCSGAQVTATAAAVVNNWLYKPAGGTQVAVGSNSISSNAITVVMNISSLNRIDTVFAELTPSGCRDTMLITVQPQPNITTPNQTVCSGATVTIAASLSVDNWFYKPEGGVAVAAGAGSPTSNPIVVINNSGAARIDTVFAEYLTGCRDTALITVGPAPNILTPAPTVCSRGIVTVAAAALVDSWLYKPAGGAAVGVGTASVSSNPIVTAQNISGLNRIDTVFAILSSFGCRDTLLITVQPQPNITTPDQTVCSGITFTAFAGAVVNQWYYVEGSLPPVNAAAGSAGSGAITINPNYSGVNRTDYIIAEGVNSCRDTLVLTVLPQPNITSAPLTVCSRESVTATATAAVNWFYKPAGGTAVAAGTGTSVMNSTPTLINISGANRIDTIIAQIGSCQSTLLVTVQPQPNVITADQTVCSGVTITAGATAVVTNWYYKEGSLPQVPAGTGSMVSNPVVITPNVSGVNRTDLIIAELMPWGCTDTVVLTVSPQPDIITPNQTICSGAQLPVITATTVVNTWYYKPAGGFQIPCGTSSTTTTAIASQINTGVSNRIDTVFAENVLGCRDFILVTVQPQPNIITPNQTICSGQTITATASNTVDNWYYKPEGGVQTAAGTASLNSNPITVLQNLTVSNRIDTVFAEYVTGCRDTLLLTVQPQPNITTPNQTVCSGAAVTATAAATVDTWIYKPAGGSPMTIGTAGVSATTITLVNISAVNRIDSIFAQLATGCRDTLLVTVQPQPNITSPNITVCSGQQVQGTASSTFTVNWSYKPAGGVATAAGTGLTSAVVTTAPNLTTVNRIDTLFAAHTTGCQDTMLITVQPQPNISTPPSTICSGQTITVSAVAPVDNWFYKPAGGSLIAAGTAGISSNPITTLANTTASNRIDTVFAQLTTGCRDTLLVTVQPQPNITTVSPTVCSGQSVQGTATGAFAISWFYRPAGGVLTAAGVGTTSLPVATSPNTTTSVRIDTLFAQFVTGCRDTLLINVQPQPNFVTPNSTLCSGLPFTATVAAAVPSFFFKTGAPLSGPLTSAGSGTSVTVVPPVNTGGLGRIDTIFAQLATGCRDTLLLTVEPRPDITTPAPTSCGGGNVNLTATSSTPFLGWFYRPAGGIATAAGAGLSVTITLNNNTTGANRIDTAWAQSVNGCADTILITVQPQLNAVAPADTTICLGATVALTATGSAGITTYRWYDAITGGTLLFTGATYTTPALAATTSYFVEGETAGGCVSTIRDEVKVFITAVPPPPVVTSPLNICSNTSATISPTGSPGTYYFYKDNLIATPPFYTGMSYTTTSLTADTVIWVASVIGGCVSSTRSQVQITVSGVLTTPPLPVGASPVCTGMPYTVTGTPIVGATSYVWVLTPPAAGTITGTGTTATVSWTTTYSGPVGISYRAVGPCGTGPLSPALLINVIGAPEKPDAIDGPETVCSLATSRYSVRPVSGTGFTYIWSISPAAAGTIADSGNTAIVTWNSSYSGTVQIGVTLGSLCGATVAADPKIITFGVPPPSPIVYGRRSYCIGQRIEPMTATGTNIRWYSTPLTSGTPIATGAYFLPPVSDSLASNNTYYVTQTNDNCQSAPVAVTIVVLPPPDVSGRFVKTDVSTCGQTDGSILFDSSLVGFVFSIDGGRSFTTRRYFTNLGMGNYNLVMRDTNGCVSNPFTLVIGLSGGGVTTPAPYIDTITVCIREPNPRLTGPGTNLRWYRDPALDTLIGIGNSVPAPVPTGLPMQRFFYVTQSIGGCESPAKQVLFEVVDKPKPIITQEDSVLVSSISTDCQWYDVEGRPIPGATSPRFKPSAAGVYFVAAGRGGCKGVSANFNYNPALGMATAIEAMKVSIYPNPTRGEFQIDADANKVQKLLVTVFDMAGKIVATESFESASGKIDLSRAPAGVYTVRVNGVSLRLMLVK